jgi:hypothetical protein
MPKFPSLSGRGGFDPAASDRHVVTIATLARFGWWLAM